MLKTIAIVVVVLLAGMQGPVPYVAKIMHVFLDMDGMVGKDFEAGLASLKTVAEKPL